MSFFRNTRGLTTLEFALIAPVVTSAMVAAIEFGMILFVTTLMEGGLRDASRFGLTGALPESVSREERIVQIIEENTIGLVNISTADISHKVYPNFADIGTGEPFTDSEPFNSVYDEGELYTDVNGNGQWDDDMGSSGAGGPGDVVVYTVGYDWPLLTPLLKPFVGEDGKIHLSASTAVRNEPFNLVPPPSP